MTVREVIHALIETEDKGDDLTIEINQSELRMALDEKYDWVEFRIIGASGTSLEAEYIKPFITPKESEDT